MAPFLDAHEASDGPATVTDGVIHSSEISDGSVNKPEVYRESDLVAERYPSNGINVLIVGAGPGGLLSAMECWRKGCSVRIIDRSSGPIETGVLTTSRNR